MTLLPRIMIAAAHKSSGKTVVSTGIAAALTMQGTQVAPFKKGPDYIDPMWLRLACGTPAYNLDFNTQSHAEISALFAAKASRTGVSLIEATKGLFDGVSQDGSDSNAALATLLSVPVVLVIDARGVTRGVAPLLQGYAAFDPDVQIAGVILNKTGGARHESKLRAAVETYTDMPVLGMIGAASDMDISERHLGLTTPGELAGTARFVQGVGRRVADSVDLNQLMRIAGRAPAAPRLGPLGSPQPPDLPALRIGIARDAAFSFYYPDDLETFAAAGATLVPIDMTRDTTLPEIDGLFLGGGFPETQMAALSANSAMRNDVRQALENGLPTYAECGGLMYLTRAISWRGETCPMVGFLDADTVLCDRPQGRGQVRFSADKAGLWAGCQRKGRAHEFHYARLENLTDARFGRQVLRGHGINGTHDAVIKANTQAGFFHLRHTDQTPWVHDFLTFVASVRARQTAAPA